MKSGVNCIQRYAFLGRIRRTSSPCTRVTPQKVTKNYFENKIVTHGTQILRKKFGLSQIAPKMPLRCLYLQLIFTLKIISFRPHFFEGFWSNINQVRKVAIQAFFIRQQKVSSAREPARTEFFRFVIKRYTLFCEKWCKLHPNICLFGPNQAYLKSVHSVHTPKSEKKIFWK